MLPSSPDPSKRQENDEVSNETRETIDKLTNDLAVEQIRSQNVAKDLELRGRIMQSQIERLEDQHKAAHFRDPKTGRYVKKDKRNG